MKISFGNKLNIFVTAVIMTAGFILSAQTVYAGDDKVKAMVTPSRIFVGQPGELKLSSPYGYPRIRHLPDVDGIRWKSQGGNTSLLRIPGKTEYIRKYSFVATSTGILEIPALVGTVNGERFDTTPVPFTVVHDPFVITAPEPNSDGKYTFEQLLFMKMELMTTKREFMVGEQIPLEIRMYGLAQLDPEFGMPEIKNDNIYIEEYKDVRGGSSQFKAGSRYQQQVGKFKFLFRQYTTVFRPITPGELKLTATGLCNYTDPNRRSSRDPFNDPFFRGFGFGGRNQSSRNLSASLPSIEVKPLPPKPKDAMFLGLVGDFEVDTSLSNGKLQVGEPLTLTVRIVGKGDFSPLKTPELNIPGFRMYPPETDREKGSPGTVRKAEIRYVLLPLKPGRNTVAINPAVYSLQQHKYVEFPFKKVVNIAKAPGGGSGRQVYLDSKQINSKLAGYKKEMSKRDKSAGILYLKRNPAGGVSVPLWKNNIFWIIILIVLAPVLWLLSEVISYRRRKLGNNHLLRRKKAAQSVRGAVLKAIRKANDDDLEETVRKQLVPYLNDLLGYPPGTTPHELAERIGSPELAEALEQVGDSSYQPGAVADKKALKNQLLKAMKKISIVLLVCGFAVGGLAGDIKIKADAGKTADTNPVKISGQVVKPELSDNSIKTPEAALTAYDKGEFAKAAAYYRRRINPRKPDPAMLYNLGNCLTRMGDYSRALVCYERAWRLKPMDSDIRENLNFVRRKLELPEYGNYENPKELLVFLRDCFRPDQWLLIAACAVFLAGAALASRRVFFGRGWIFVVVVAFLVIIITSIAFFTQVSSTYADENAVVIGRDVPVYSLPSDSAAKVDVNLRDGEIITIEEQRENWVRIRAGSIQGWVHRSNIGRLWATSGG